MDCVAHQFCSWDFPGKNTRVCGCSPLQGSSPPASPALQVDSLMLGHHHHTHTPTHTHTHNKFWSCPSSALNIFLDFLECSRLLAASRSLHADHSSLPCLSDWRLLTSLGLNMMQLITNIVTILHPSSTCTFCHGTSRRGAQSLAHFWDPS